MNYTIKILFLAANPVDTGNRLRLDEEIRRIDHKIRLGTLRSRFELVSDWAVRASDLHQALLRHQPDIVHFSGHGQRGEGIVLEDDDGTGRVVDRQALADLFRLLKDNIRVVVLNACFSEDQAVGAAESIDFVIGMKDAIGDRAAVVFAADFYQALAFGRSVKEAFDLAVNQLALQGIHGADIPRLLLRDGIDPSKSKFGAHVVETARPGTHPTPGDRSMAAGRDVVGSTVVFGDNATITAIGASTVREPAKSESTDREQERRNGPLAFLPWLLSTVAISLIADMLRRFFGGDFDWADTANTLAQPVLITLAAAALFLTGTSLLPVTGPLARKTASLDVLSGRLNVKLATAVSAVGLVIALGLRLSFPALAHFYNERGSAYHTQGNASEACKSYERAVRLKPTYAAAHYNLASAYEDLHQQDRAMKEYLLAINYDSHIYPAYNNLARLYLQTGEKSDAEKALKLLDEARDRSPQDASAQSENVQYAIYKNLGWANFVLNHYDQAIVFLRRAISLQRDRAAAHCLLAEVLNRQGKAEAVDQCGDCVSLEPGETDVEAAWVYDARACLSSGASK
jgi:tetratricopeptide (TPR) repeat protein